MDRETRIAIHKKKERDTIKVGAPDINSLNEGESIRVFIHGHGVYDVVRYNNQLYYSARYSEVKDSITAKDLKLSGDTLYLGTMRFSAPDASEDSYLLKANTVEKKFEYIPVSSSIFSSVLLDTSYSITDSEPTGSIYWNSVDGTASLVLSGGSIYDFGQELVFYGKAYGNISNGDIVQFSGAQGDHVLMKTAVAAEIIANPEYLMGIATQDILNGSFGRVTWFGYVHDFSTGSWSLGDILYFDNSTGALTNVEPTEPERKIQIAAIVKEETSPAASNGIILVRPTFGRKLSELEDVGVNTASATNKYLIYDSATQVWKPSPLESISVGTTGNKVDISENGIVLSGTAKFYDDLQVSINNIKVPASNAPTERLYNFGITGGVTFPALGFAVGNYIYFEVQTRHGIELSSVLENHIHYVLPNTTSIGNTFKFQLDVIYGNIGGTWTKPAGSPFSATGIVAAGDNTSHRYLDIASIPAVNTGISTIYKCKLTRVTTALSPYASEVYLVFSDFHAIFDGLGSVSEYSKT